MADRPSRNKPFRRTIGGPGPTGDEPTRTRDRFELAVLPHRDAAHNLARRLMDDSAAAEDIVQEAMARALARFSSFKGRRPRRWLLRIVRNLAQSSLAFHHRNPLVPLVIPERQVDGEGNPITNLPSDDDNPETALIRLGDRIRVRQMIAALPVELRETLVLREIEGFSYKEIAAVTQVPIGTVMSRLWRARQTLLRALAGQEEHA